MSKSKDGGGNSGSSKHEKFSYISNCLPMKGCLHLGSKRTAKNLPNTASVTYNLTSGKKADRREAVFEASAAEPEDSKMAHTKQWLANLSTMVSFDPSYLEDSELNDTLIDNQKTPTGVKSQGKAANYNDQRDRHLSDGRSQENPRALPPLMPADDSILQMKMNGSARNNTQCSDSFASSTDCDRSRCCSQQQQQQPAYQQQRRHHRRRLDRTGSSASGMSASTLGGHTGNHGAWQNHYSCNNGDTSSICSGSSSTISLATELVVLDLDSCSHLGITIVGHSNAAQGDCGIFVGCVKKGGAAARSGRIEPGDLILEVNDIDLERMTNEQALTVLKGELARGGMVKILVAKYWDMNEGGSGGPDVHKEPLYEAVGSVRSVPMSRPGSVCAGHIIESAESMYRGPLPQHSMTLDRRLRSAAAARPSGVGNQSTGGGDTGTARPFRGIELIDWIQGQVAGLGGRKDAQRYAQNLLKAGHICVLEGSSSASSPSDGDKTFHEHRYYSFGHGAGALSNDTRQSKML